jgi:hypothetical protein
MPVTLGPHATIVDSDHILCACPQHGCSDKSITFGGKILNGRIFSRKNYPRHLQQTPHVQTSNPTTELPVIQGDTTTPLLNSQAGVSSSSCNSKDSGGQ